MSELSPDILLRAYGMGIFPMAEHRDDPALFWVDPKRRGVMPLDGFHMSRSLIKAMRRCSYRLDINKDFNGVVAGCADRAETWINGELTALYGELHARGDAHSMELWDDETLVGGVYGVTLGAAFFGESMFSRRPNASKMVMAALVDRLRSTGFTLFDTQFLTEHLASLGGVEIPRDVYHGKLEHALNRKARFTTAPVPTLQEVVQRMTQTS